MLKDVFVLLRPWQWIKNTFVFSVSFFAGVLFIPANFGLVLSAFIFFCAVSSSVYIFNDIKDMERDRQHPAKKDRPLTAGRLNPRFAWILCVVLACGGLVGAFYLSRQSALLLGLYLCLNAVYTLYLKKVLFLDVLCISAGFILRVLVGGAILDIDVSRWLLVCTLALSLLLALSKRRQELVVVNGENGASREVLSKYSLELLDQTITISATATIMTYLLYVLEGRPSQFAWGQESFYTCLFVIYGVFRYMALVRAKKDVEDPAFLLLTDRPLMLTCLGWALSWLMLLYLG